MAKARLERRGWEADDLPDVGVQCGGHALDRPPSASRICRCVPTRLTPHRCRGVETVEQFPSSAYTVPFLLEIEQRV